MQNYVTEVTQALQAGKSVERIRLKYGISREESAEWVALIRQMQQTMRPVTPAADFSKRLKADLIGDDLPASQGVLRQILKLPARVQFAALAALAGGFVLLLRQRFLGEEPPSTAPNENTAPEISN